MKNFKRIIIGCFVGAAVMSFYGIASLALTVHIPLPLALIAPLLVDIGAVGTALVWLSPDVPKRARVVAAVFAFVLLMASTAGNVVHQVLLMAPGSPLMPVAVAFGVMPPVVVFVMALLQHLMNPSSVDISPSAPAPGTVGAHVAAVTAETAAVEAVAASEPRSEGDGTGEAAEAATANVQPLHIVKARPSAAERARQLKRTHGWGRPRILTALTEEGYEGVTNHQVQQALKEQTA